MTATSMVTTGERDLIRDRAAITDAIVDADERGDDLTAEACRESAEAEDATLVLTTYVHLMPDSENRTRRAVDEAWRAPTMPQDDEEAL